MVLTQRNRLRPCPNRVIISFTLVRMLADCVGSVKYCDISIVLGIVLEPMRRLQRIVASAYGIYQTQSPSLRVYVKEFMTGFAVSLVRLINFECCLPLRNITSCCTIVYLTTPLIPPLRQPVNNQNSSMKSERVVLHNGAFATPRCRLINLSHLTEVFETQSGQWNMKC